MKDCRYIAFSLLSRQKDYSMKKISCKNLMRRMELCESVGLDVGICNSKVAKLNLFSVLNFLYLTCKTYHTKFQFQLQFKKNRWTNCFGKLLQMKKHFKLCKFICGLEQYCCNSQNGMLCI